MASVSHREAVRLNRAEKPWRPSRCRRGNQKQEEEGKGEGSDPEQRQTQELLRRLRSVLNKVTPQNFQPVMRQLSQMPVNSEPCLSGMVSMVFERAVSEPQISMVYANICRCLMGLKVPSEHKRSVTVNFRKLLLNLCQKEFERDLDVEILEKKQIELQIHVVLGGSRQQHLKEELEELQDQVHQRSLGVVKFIGELLKLKMLTEAIIHECIVKLLKKHTDGSLECLCVLLSTAGKDLDYDKAKPRMDAYLNTIEKIIKERKTSSRIRFMLQDILDLRRTNWIPRHADPGPQTIAKIREQALGEKVERPGPALSRKVKRPGSAPSREKGSQGSSGGPREGPRGPGAGVCVPQPLSSVKAPHQSCQTSPSLGQTPKPTTLDLITHLMVLGEDKTSVRSGTNHSESVSKELSPTLKQFLPPVAAVPGVSPLEEDLSCPVCCDIYTDPLVLPCSHSFCRPCLERSWRECVRQECLVCRQKAPSQSPTPNLALRNVCESFLKEQSTGAPTVEAPRDAAETHSALCLEHREKLQFFCQDEGQLACVECVTQSHRAHSVCSAKKAANERRDELKCLMMSLEDDVKKNKSLLEEVIAHIKSQAEQTERQIKEEFVKLHQFLREEEEARIATLREEEREKTANLEEKMEAIESVISSLSERMKPIQELMETDEVSFIQRFSETKERTLEAFQHPQPGFWLLLDVSKYLDNLSHGVWDRMKEPLADSAVMLNSNTSQSHPNVPYPEHLACTAASLEPSVKCGSGEVPPSPERNTTVPEVLGADGFTSRWRLEVDEDC